jgi:hypothetical protein
VRVWARTPRSATRSRYSRGIYGLGSRACRDHGGNAGALGPRLACRPAGRGRAHSVEPDVVGPRERAQHDAGAREPPREPQRGDDNTRHAWRRRVRRLRVRRRRAWRRRERWRRRRRRVGRLGSGAQAPNAQVRDDGPRLRHVLLPKFPASSAIFFNIVPMRCVVMPLLASLDGPRALYGVLTWSPKAHHSSEGLLRVAGGPMGGPSICFIWPGAARQEQLCQKILISAEFGR